MVICIICTETIISSTAIAAKKYLGRKLIREGIEQEKKK